MIQGITIEKYKRRKTNRNLYCVVSKWNQGLSPSEYNEEMNQQKGEDNVTLSEYEKMRLAKIKRNSDRLISLGFLKPFVPKRVIAGYTIKRKRKIVSPGTTRVKLNRMAKDKARLLQNTETVTTCTTKTKQMNKKSAAKPVEKIDVATGVILQRYKSGCAAAEDVKGHQSEISNACNQRMRIHKGYYWKFAAGYGQNVNRKVIKIGKTRVCKQFINEENNQIGMFLGVVSCKCGRYYRVLYDDGDIEDMTSKEVLLCMK